MKKHYLLAVVLAAMVAASCSTTTFSEYRGPSVVEGKGVPLRLRDIKKNEWPRFVALTVPVEFQEVGADFQTNTVKLPQGTPVMLLEVERDSLVIAYKKLPPGTPTKQHPLHNPVAVGERQAWHSKRLPATATDLLARVQAARQQIAKWEEADKQRSLNTSAASQISRDSQSVGPWTKYAEAQKPAGANQTAGAAWRLRRALQGGGYAGIGGGHWIQKNIDSGAFILLEDGSLWQIDPLERVDASLWLETSSITVVESSEGSLGYDYLLVNTDDGEKAHAKPVGSQ